MENKETLFTVGALARHCGVTVRTLQYYDKQGLLSPSSYTEGGRRLYDREDIILLQQILFLKSFGFSLDEIRDRLLHTDSPKEISRMFSRQRDVLKKQIHNLEKTIDLLSKTITEIEMNGDLGTEKIMTIMAMMNHYNPYSFVFRYFGPDEMKTIYKKIDGDAQQEKLEAEWAVWQDMFTQLVTLHQTGADPEGEAGQALAAKWWAHVNTFTEGDSDMLKSLMDIGSDVNNWPDQTGEFKDATKDFLGKAFDKYLKNIGVMPEGSTNQ